MENAEGKCKISDISSLQNLQEMGPDAQVEGLAFDGSEGISFGAKKREGRGHRGRQRSQGKAEVIGTEASGTAAANSRKKTVFLQQLLRFSVM